MRRIMAMVLLLALPAEASVREGDDIQGLWRTEPRDNGAYIEIRIRPCRANPATRCGVVAAARAGARPDIVGEPILRNLEHDEDGSWHRGEIIRPGEGTVYKSQVTRQGDSLEVEGCVAGGLLCGGQTWERVR